MSKKVLCVLPVAERHKEKLERAGKDCEFTYVSADAVQASVLSFCSSTLRGRTPIS